MIPRGALTVAAVRALTLEDTLRSTLAFERHAPRLERSTGMRAQILYVRRENANECCWQAQRLASACDYALSGGRPRDAITGLRK